VNVIDLSMDFLQNRGYLSGVFYHVFRSIRFAQHMGYLLQLLNRWIYDSVTSIKSLVWQTFFYVTIL